MPLKDWDIKINRGILTGCNEAFIIDGKTKDRLIEEDSRSAEIIRPILRGRDIKRYSYDFKDMWLIAAHNGYSLGGKKISPVNIEDYPVIKAHLDQYWEQISERDDKGCTPYNLRNCAYMDDFSKQKIVWGNLCQRAQFAIAEEGIMINAPSPLITPAEPWLLVFMNSKPADWYIRSQGVTRNGGYFEYKPMFVETLPIPQFSKEQAERLNGYMKLIQNAEHQEAKAAEIDADSYIASILGLTEEEQHFLRNH